MKNTEKLIIKLRKELDLCLPADTEVRRTRAGRWQLGSGAFSWFLYSRENSWVSNYGSSETVTKILNAKNIKLLHRGGFSEITSD